MRIVSDTGTCIASIYGSTILSFLIVNGLYYVLPLRAKNWINYIYSTSIGHIGTVSHRLFNNGRTPTIIRITSTVRIVGVLPGRPIPNGALPIPNANLLNTNTNNAVQLFTVPNPVPQGVIIPSNSILDLPIQSVEGQRIINRLIPITMIPPNTITIGEIIAHGDFNFTNNGNLFIAEITSTRNFTSVRELGLQTLSDDLRISDLFAISLTKVKDWFTYHFGALDIRTGHPFQPYGGEDRIQAGGNSPTSSSDIWETLIINNPYGESKLSTEVLSACADSTDLNLSYQVADIIKNITIG